jgi:hypothetical protein
MFTTQKFTATLVGTVLGLATVAATVTPAFTAIADPSDTHWSTDDVSIVAEDTHWSNPSDTHWTIDDTHW